MSTKTYIFELNPYHLPTKPFAAGENQKAVLGALRSALGIVDAAICAAVKRAAPSGLDGPADKILVICTGEQFAEFMVLRDRLGGKNAFKELNVRVVTSGMTVPGIGKNGTVFDCREVPVKTEGFADTRRVRMYPSPTDAALRSLTGRKAFEPRQYQKDALAALESSIRNGTDFRWDFGGKPSWVKAQFLGQVHDELQFKAVLSDPPWVVKADFADLEKRVVALEGAELDRKVMDSLNNKRERHYGMVRELGMGYGKAMDWWTGYGGDVYNNLWSDMAKQAANAQAKIDRGTAEAYLNKRLEGYERMRRENHPKSAHEKEIRAALSASDRPYAEIAMLRNNKTTGDWARRELLPHMTRLEVADILDSVYPAQESEFFDKGHAHRYLEAKIAQLKNKAVEHFDRQYKCQPDSYGWKLNKHMRECAKDRINELCNALEKGVRPDTEIKYLNMGGSGTMPVGFEEWTRARVGALLGRVYPVKTPGFKVVFSQPLQQWTPFESVQVIDRLHRPAVVQQVEDAWDAYRKIGADKPFTIEMNVRSRGSIKRTWQTVEASFINGGKHVHYKKSGGGTGVMPVTMKAYFKWDTFKEVLVLDKGDELAAWVHDFLNRGHISEGNYRAIKKAFGIEHCRELAEDRHEALRDACRAVAAAKGDGETRFRKMKDALAKADQRLMQLQAAAAVDERGRDKLATEVLQLREHVEVLRHKADQAFLDGRGFQRRDLVDKLRIEAAQWFAQSKLPGIGPLDALSAKVIDEALRKYADKIERGVI